MIASFIGFTGAAVMQTNAWIVDHATPQYLQSCYHGLISSALVLHQLFV